MSLLTILSKIQNNIQQLFIPFNIVLLIILKFEIQILLKSLEQVIHLLIHFILFTFTLLCIHFVDVISSVFNVYEWLNLTMFFNISNV